MIAPFPCLDFCSLPRPRFVSISLELTRILAPIMEGLPRATAAVSSCLTVAASCSAAGCGRDKLVGVWRYGFLRKLGPNLRRGELTAPIEECTVGLRA